MSRPYRGRIAPSPTGYLHMGHGRTFWMAYARAREAGGALLLRMEDLDRARCRPEFVEAVYEDLSWMGIGWTEGPRKGGPHAPYSQLERMPVFLEAWKYLKEAGYIYPCTRSRKDVREAASAPHEMPGAVPPEPIFPANWRPDPGVEKECDKPDGVNWRFRVPEGETIGFEDWMQGAQAFTAGEHFGDFLVWRRDGMPAYELAVVVDDAAMQITEVVRGKDLLLSTARQLLLFRALQQNPPAFCHADLVADEQGERLAKRNEALSMKSLRESGREFAHCLAELEGRLV